MAAQLGADDVREGVAEQLLAGRDEQPQMPIWLAIEPVGAEQPGLVPEQLGDLAPRAR